MTATIEAAGHANWVPLPLDTDPDVVVDRLRGRYAATTPEDDLALQLDLVRGTIAALRRQDDSWEETGTAIGAAWALTPDPERLEIAALAVLRASAVTAATGAEAVMSELIGEGPVHGQPVVESLDGAGTGCYRLRYRPIVENAEEREVHQLNAVVWLRPEQSLVYVLSSYVQSLLEADTIGDLLEELALGMAGF